MDKSKVIEAIRRHCGPMRDMLGPQDWEITWLAEAAVTANSKASCSWNVHYSTATIRIDPACHDNEDEIVDSMFHELCHVLLSPFALYREVTTQHIASGSTAERRDNCLFDYAQEQAVLRMERLWNHGGLRDHYLERFTAG